MNAIKGAICGDIIGSTFEVNSIKSKEFELFEFGSTFTDDTVMTIAVANWLIKDKNSKEVLINELKYFGNKYPNSGYGGMFRRWLKDSNSKPYGSWANGSAMRVSACAYMGKSLKEVNKLAYTSAIVTHNHPEGIKGAQSVADATYLALKGESKNNIKKHVEKNYEYDLSNTFDKIRPDYLFDVSCAGSVPESIICFLEAEDYEDAIRNAISLGGDADTQASICGSIAGAYWGVPDEIWDESMEYLDYEFIEVLDNFEKNIITDE